MVWSVFADDHVRATSRVIDINPTMAVPASQEEIQEAGDTMCVLLIIRSRLSARGHEQQRSVHPLHAHGVSRSCSKAMSAC